MNNPRPNSQPFTFYLNTENPENLREGLETWLKLGLIDHQQVKQICRVYLSSPIREVNTTFAPEIEIISSPPPVSQPSIPPSFVFTPFAKFQQLLTQLITSFREELSVRWLLFLGLFLVLVSSGVLAATQWKSFPNIGQYLILFTYTLGFFGVSFWANKQENLQLTAKALENIALLLIPINFWAIDGFNLWNNGLNFIIILITSLTLSYLYYHYRHTSQDIWIIINFLGLCYLQWGWNIPRIPPIFVYIAILATIIILTFLRVPKILPDTHPYPRDTAKGFVIYGLTTLLFRAIFILHLPLSQIGVAISLMGWLLQCHNPRLKPYERYSFLTSLLENIGAFLLLIGWLSVIHETIPIKALIITLFALHFFQQRLQRQGLKRDLLLLFIIGLQGYYLLGRLIPLEMREDIFNFTVNLSKESDHPKSVLNISFFPYLWGWVRITEIFYQQNKIKLASFSEKLVYLLGTLVIISASVNPLWLSLSLLLSSITLLYIIRFQPKKLSLIYFSHCLGLGGIISLTAWGFPSLSLSQWGGILLIFMVIEWGLSILRTVPNNTPIQQTFYQSSWYLGFIFAILSYAVLLISLEPLFLTGSRNFQGLLWLVTPLTLTGVASQVKNRHQTRRITFLSGYALIIAQSLTLWHPDTRLISLGLSAIVMIGNSYYLRHPIAGILQIGFTLAFINSGYLKQFSGSLDQILLLNSLLVCLLWLTYLYSHSSRHFWGKIYSKASDQWGVWLSSLIIISLTVIQVYSNITHINYLITIFILITILSYRYFKKPYDITIYTLAWLIELAILQGVSLQNGTVLIIASLNSITGLLSLFVIHSLFSNYPHLRSLYSLKIFPLIFGMMGILWPIEELNQYTGLFTISCSIIGLGIINYLENRKIVAYLSLLGISLGIYQIPIYYLLQTQNNLPQQSLYLILISIFIAVGYQLILQLSYQQHKQTLYSLTLNEINTISHFHWFLGSLLKVYLCLIVISNNSFNFNIHPLSVIASLTLAVYGLLQGRKNNQDYWIYLGFFDIIITLMIARFIWLNLEIFDPYWTLISVIIALFIYHLPWHLWGWNRNPWQKISLNLPIFITLITLQPISDPSLLIVIGYYGYITYKTHNIRWSYLSLIVLNFLICRFFYQNDVNEILGYVSLIGLSLIYIAQIDPIFQQSTHRKLRHNLRLTGSGIIGVTALLFYQKTGITPASLGLLGTFLGLGLHIRSFLFVGTTTFILTIVYQLLILSFQYSFLKWVLGLLLGIMLIAIAANFEQRKGQIISIWQSWQENWEDWE